MSKEKKNERISKSSYPVTQPSFNEWCIEFNVSSQYVDNKLYDMYNQTGTQKIILSKFLKQTK